MMRQPDPENIEKVLALLYSLEAALQKQRERHKQAAEGTPGKWESPAQQGYQQFNETLMREQDRDAKLAVAYGEAFATYLYLKRYRELLGENTDLLERAQQLLSILVRNDALATGSDYFAEISKEIIELKERLSEKHADIQAKDHVILSNAMWLLDDHLRQHLHHRPPKPRT